MPTAVSKGRVSSRAVIQRMTAVLTSKQQELVALEGEHDALSYQHRLLVALCDSFDWLRCNNHLQTDGDQHALAAVARELATAEELQLLSQLANTPYTMRFAALQPEQQQQQQQGGSQDDAVPVAPPHDMLYLFHQLVLMPPLHGVHSWQLADLQADYMSTVRELSLNLYLHQAGSAANDRTGLSPLEKIASIMSRHLHLLSSLSLAQRGDLISAFLLSNCETGEIISEVSQERHRRVLPHLNLSAQQQQHVAAGSPVFVRLLAPIMRELKQLQQQELAGSSSNTLQALGTASGSDVSGSTAVATSIGEPPADLGMPSPFTNAKVLGKQQWRAQRMEILLQKEYLIRSYAACFVYGCLSWTQLATLSVLMTPFSPAPAVLVQEILNSLNEQPEKPDKLDADQQQQRTKQRRRRMSGQQRQRQQERNEDTNNVNVTPALPRFLRLQCPHQSKGDLPDSVLQEQSSMKPESTEGRQPMEV